MGVLLLLDLYTEIKLHVGVFHYVTVEVFLLYCEYLKQTCEETNRIHTSATKSLTLGLTEHTKKNRLE